MFKKFIEKWKKQIEKVERKDIEYIKKYPARWKLMMGSFILIYLGISIVFISFDSSFIVFASMMFISLFVLEKICYDRYKKAFQKQS